MFRRFLVLALVAVSAAFAQDTAPTGFSPSSQDRPLAGRLEGDRYYSPTGAYSITVPLVPGLSGVIRDTPNAVTFQDPYSIYITVWCNAQDAPEKWKYDVQGPKQYLQDFFYNYVWRDFASYPGAKYDTNARFQPHLFGGALYTFITLPGGSMLPSAELQVDIGAPPVVAKRGNMIFVHDGYIYVISTELAERITRRAGYNLTDEEENILLRDRLTDIANKIHFLPVPTR